MAAETLMETTTHLLPLQIFYEMKGKFLPSIEEIHGYEMPFPERHLLVHDSDMTSRLEGFYVKSIYIDKVQKKQRGETLDREVILRLNDYSKPVEYGVIRIDLFTFSDELKKTILLSDTPFGVALKRSGIPFKSKPQFYFCIQSDQFMMDIFYLKEAQAQYGRCNQLSD